MPIFSITNKANSCSTKKFNIICPWSNVDVDLKIFSFFAAGGVEIGVGGDVKIDLKGVRGVRGDFSKISQLKQRQKLEYWGREPWSIGYGYEGHGFKSQHRILDVHDIFYIDLL